MEGMGWTEIRMEKDNRTDGKGWSDMTEIKGWSDMMEGIGWMARKTEGIGWRVIRMEETW
jgi:hypothetical protein